MSEQPDLKALWADVIKKVKEGDINLSLWDALGAAVPLVVDGDQFVVGFAPRKRNFSIYLNCAFDGAEDLLDRLGKHKTGVACLYVNKLDDVDRDVLRELIERAAANVRATSGEAG